MSDVTTKHDAADHCWSMNQAAEKHCSAYPVSFYASTKENKRQNWELATLIGAPLSKLTGAFTANVCRKREAYQRVGEGGGADATEWKASSSHLPCPCPCPLSSPPVYSPLSVSRLRVWMFPTLSSPAFVPGRKCGAFSHPASFPKWNWRVRDSPEIAFLWWLTCAKEAICSSINRGMTRSLTPSCIVSHPNCFLCAAVFDPCMPRHISSIQGGKMQFFWSAYILQFWN